MRRGIVVSTCPANVRTWLPDCLESIRTDVTVVQSGIGGFETSGLIAGTHLFDEFWLFPDTVVVEDYGLLRDLLDEPGAVSVGAGYFCCMGKFVTEHVLSMGLPAYPWSKYAAVDVELGWMPKQAVASGAKVLDERFTDGSEFVERHGRRNMVLRTGLLTKFKGTWDRSMIADPLTGFEPD